MHLIPPLPPTQALSSSTFRPPPLDASYTLPEIYEWQAKHSPEHRLFIYANGEGIIKSICWSEAVRAVRRGASIMRNRMGWKPGSEAHVIAILSASDTITYHTIAMGILRAGYAAFFISPRNSAVAIAHLIDKANVKHIIVGREQNLIDLANESLDVHRHAYPDARYRPDSSPSPLFEDLFLSPGEVEDIPFENKRPEATAVILHSSGSTSFPKPVPLTNRRLIELAIPPWFGDRDLTGKVFGFHSTPMYHGMGTFMLCWPPSCGLTIAVFEPKSPAQLPTPDNTFHGALTTDSDVVLCVPAIVEAWSHNQDHVDWLATRIGLIFSGGPLNKSIGDYLVSRGVSISSLYGSSEGGVQSLIFSAKANTDWEYFEFPRYLTPELIPYEDNTYEFVIVANQYCTPSILNTKINKVDAYATSDLLQPHPTKRGYFRVYGRADDQLIHNTGEKAKSILNQDPHIHASIVFGHGQFQIGALLDPTSDYKFDPLDEAKLANFRNLICPRAAIQKMTVVSKPTKPFHYTAKSSVRRQATITDYKTEIEELYETYEASAQSTIPPPSQWDIESTTSFIRSLVLKILTHTLADGDDIFEHGCDSLQATYIRNTLLKVIKDSTKLDPRRIPESIGIGKGNDRSTHYQRTDAMKKMVLKYSSGLPLCQIPVVAKTAPEVVLITGTTGGFGSHLLLNLYNATNVLRIYAFNRPGKHGQPTLEKNKSAFASRGLDTAILDSEKVVLLTGDLSLPYFGLSLDAFNDFEYIPLTLLVAWTVDFNLSLASFETNVKGLRGMVDFALTSPLPTPPRFVFTSSIAVFQNLSVKEPLVEDFVDPTAAVGTGYGESKWVSEQLLREVASQTALKVVIIRLGQLCGNTNSVWNTKEWLPALVHSAQKLGCLPDDNGDISWIPIHIAAAALVDSCGASAPGSVLHLAHPRPVAWSSVARALSSELSVDLVTYDEWLAKLEELAALDITDKFKQTPALQLLGFFRSLATKSNGDAFGLPKLDLTQALAASPTLANPVLPQLGDSDVKGWIEYWRRVGFLE
ncbi:acetyl-CoA synthetase-like protein [Infundibulicybe gibba]|nr:acetyl-CoA synthetase-like protein [Infundibulicybe gibba]